MLGEAGVHILWLHPSKKIWKFEQSNQGSLDDTYEPYYQTIDTSAGAEYIEEIYDDFDDHIAIWKGQYLELNSHIQKYQHSVHRVLTILRPGSIWYKKEARSSKRIDIKESSWFFWEQHLPSRQTRVKSIYCPQNFGGFPKIDWSCFQTK